MKLNYTLTKAHYLSGSVAATPPRPTNPWMYYGQALTASGLFLTLAGLAIFDEPCPLLAIAAAGYAAVTLRQSLPYHRVILRYAEERARKFRPREVALEFDEYGLKESALGVALACPWSSVREVRWTAEVILILLTTGVFLFVPVTAFSGSETTAEGFVAFAREQILKNRAPAQNPPLAS